MEELMTKSGCFTVKCDCCGSFGGNYKLATRITLKHNTLHICNDCYKSFKLIVNS